MKKKLVIFGAGNHARMISSIFKDQFKIIGFVTTRKEKKKSINKIKIYNFVKKDILKLSKVQKCHFIIGIGDNKIRKKIVKMILSQKIRLKWAKLISHNSVISDDSNIGEGSLIMPGCILNNNVNIKNHCIINTGSIIEHDNIFENFSSSGPGIITGGNVHLGETSYIGIGSVIKEKIKISKNIFIGGKSFVNKNLKQSGLYFGTPVKRIKNI